MYCWRVQLPEGCLELDLRKLTSKEIQLTVNITF